ncbi:hypothetical protein U27_01038 [Candidatus Vecturithrix granuli]|uniref:Uncharacterized protein n=1 Tax=Vecturithrix granuli TaxID=1499967 RepID=A0A081C985_VECG1|nr:hypothetical protein U27_01038 [Candidatus Vecturithrix granuli]
MNWLSFLIGMIVGGGIVYYFWRSKAQKTGKTERMLRQRLADAESETHDLTTQLDGLNRQEEKLAACQAELQKKTKDLQQVTEQLSTAEIQIRSLRDQLTVAETNVETQTKHLSTAEIQIRSLRDQLTVAETNAETQTKQLSTAEAQIQTLREQLVVARTQSEAASEEPLPIMEKEAGTAVQPDDLTKIEGVGPKVAQVLNESGILTFAQLAQTDVNRLRTILQDAGSRFRMIEPESWPEQAELAANGDWSALTKLQDELDGGKYRR